MKTFEEKVKDMTAGEIITAMTEGLKAKRVAVDMDTFGIAVGDVCFGCAATTAVCQISGEVFPASVISDRGDRAAFIHTDERFLEIFETAIDSLRHGKVAYYNYHASEGGFATIEAPGDLKLPELSNRNYLENLAPYEELARRQK